MQNLAVHLLPGVNGLTTEFQRICALRQRDWKQEILQDDLAEKMTAFYRTPWGQQKLKLIQAATLADLHDLRGAVGILLPGEGKTIVSLLAPTVLRAERPLLLVPASLREKTIRDAKLLSQHWVMKRAFLVDNYAKYDPTKAQYSGIVVEAYDVVSRDGGEEILNKIKPDFICADEAHKLKNLEAAVTKKVVRYLRNNEHCTFLPLSGTVMVRSLLETWHLMYFALRHHMPLPRMRSEMEHWCDAIDEKKNYTPTKTLGGALYTFSSPEDKLEVNKMLHLAGGNAWVLASPEGIAIARRAVRNRLDSAPGVIISRDSDVTSSILITKLNWTPGQKSLDMIKRVREGETPNGDIVLDEKNEKAKIHGAQSWRLARQLACGFFYYWNPPPPPSWLLRRKNYFKKLRYILMYNEQRLDSVYQIEQAIENRKLNNPELLEAFYEWREVRDTYEINKQDVWVDDVILQQTMSWMHKHRHTGGIVWTDHRAFGMKLSELTGVGFCADEGCDQRGVLIDDYAGRMVIASVKGNGEGRNLQAWHRNLLVSLPPNGGTWEQVLARTHRYGQPEDCVYFDWIAACWEYEEGFKQAIRDAENIEQTTGQRQRLLYADKI